MARRKQSVDKTIRPEYIPLTIWEDYQECKDEPETRAAFERVMFGDEDKNSSQVMGRTWRAIEKARKAKFQQMVESSGGRISEEGESFDERGTYSMLSVHIRNFADVRTEDFSKMQSPGEKAERLRDMVKVGNRFLKLLESTHGVGRYDELVPNKEGWEAIEKRVMDECSRPGSRIDWAIREASMDISIRAFKHESEGQGKEYLFSDTAKARAKARRAMLEEYEDELREKIIPMVIDCTIRNFGIPLSDHLRDALEDMERDEWWMMKKRHILPRPDVNDPRKSYVVRYFAGSFCTLFCIPPDKPLALAMLGEAGIISPLGRFVGAMLGEEITREDVKNILKGYPPSGIKIKQNWDAGGEEEGED